MTSTRLRDRAWFIVMIVALCVIYLPGLRSALIFDDGRLLDGSVFQDYAAIWPLKTRSLSYGSFVWINAIFGDSWIPQRAFNLVLHVITSVGVFLLVRRLLDCATDKDSAVAGGVDEHSAQRELAAGAAALLFALNPLAVYAVAYLIQRSTVMATCFSVYSLLLVVVAARAQRAWLLTVALLLYGLAVLSKESAVALPLPGLVLYLGCAPPSRKRFVAATAGTLLAAAVAVMFLIQYRQDALGVAFDQASTEYLKALARINPAVETHGLLYSIVNQAGLFFKYGLLWWLPYPGWMSIDIRPPFPISLLGFPYVLGVIGYLGLLGAAGYAVIRFHDWRRIAGIGLLVPLLLFTTEFVVLWVQDPFVLYRAYLWSIGAAILVGVVVLRFPIGYSSAIVLVVALLWVGVAVERVHSLGTEASAWGDAARKVDLAAGPNAVGRWRPLVNYGNQLLVEGKPDAAIVEYRKALPLEESKWLIHYQLGLAYQVKGDINTALSEFAQAGEQTAPSDKTALIAFQQGQLLTRLGRCPEAVEQSSKALAALADNENKIAALGSMAQCHIRLAMPAQAVDDYRRILQIEPGRRSAKIGLAMALSRDGQADAALQILDELIARGDAAELRLARALTFRTMNRRDALAKDVEAGLKLDPANPLLQGLQRELDASRR